ncbi:hypothetical protein AB0H00_28865 [Nocardia sp. NPDC023852]|uniref:hypothetical protein n=1 Tax=Nocardia sp. NPDC023852 TaxID=3154697 RepID=UPI0034020051
MPETPSPTEGVTSELSDTQVVSETTPDEILASIKADVQRIIATTAFEPNNQTRWQVTKSGISSYLQQRYRQGDLHGETSDQAYWVKVGLGATMTEQDVAEGRMIVELGVLLTAADVQPSGRAVGIKPSDYTTLTFTEGTGAD